MALNKHVMTAAVMAVVVASLLACSGAPVGPAQAPRHFGMPAPARSPETQVGVDPHASPSPRATSMAPRDEMGMGMKMDLFAFPAGLDDNLFVYDFKSAEVFAIPGAGSGIEHPMVFDMDRKICFGQDGLVWIWDLLSETKLRLDDVSAFAPVEIPDPAMQANVVAIHNDADVLLFVPAGIQPPGVKLPTGEGGDATGIHGDDTRTSATGSIPRGMARPEAMARHQEAPGRRDMAGHQGMEEMAPFSPQGVTLTIPGFRQLAIDHGGIRNAQIDAWATRLAVITRDGALWVYDIRSGALDQIVEARLVGNGSADNLDLDPSGRNILFSSGRRLFRYDLATRTLDPMPFLAQAVPFMEAHFLMWTSKVEFIALVILEHPVRRWVMYNWVTESVRTAFSLNNAFGGGANLLSDPLTRLAQRSVE